jgi:hypothetical protein
VLVKVYTHYSGLAPAIARAGYEPVLLEPVDISPGPVRAELVRGPGDVMLVVAHPMHKPLIFQKTPELHGWELTR